VSTLTARRGRRRGGARGRRPGSDWEGLAGLLALSAPVWLIALQAGCGELLAVGGVSPDVIALAIAAVAWTRPGFGAVLFATVLGCATDVTSALPWGLDGARLAFMAAAFVTLRQGFAAEVPGTNALMVAVLVAALELSRAALVVSWLPGIDPGAAFAHAGWVALYSAPFALAAVAASRSLEVGGSRAGPS
jgi:cell shape-determining protein MreD